MVGSSRRAGWFAPQVINHLRPIAPLPLRPPGRPPFPRSCHKGKPLASYTPHCQRVPTSQSSRALSSGIAAHEDSSGQEAPSDPGKPGRAGDPCIHSHTGSSQRHTVLGGGHAGEPRGTKGTRVPPSPFPSGALSLRCRRSAPTAGFSTASISSSSAAAAATSSSSPRSRPQRACSLSRFRLARVPLQRRSASGTTPGVTSRGGRWGWGKCEAGRPGCAPCVPGAEGGGRILRAAGPVAQRRARISSRGRSCVRGPSRARDSGKINK